MQKIPKPPESLEEPLGLYIHWPFCVSKCPYCDFNSHVREKIDVDAWKKAYTRDLTFFQTLTKDRPLTSIFFGGGTPSLMPPDVVEHILKTVQDLWPLDPGIEITLEANPNSSEKDRFEGFRKAGINRLSMGIQSLRSPILKSLGRAHHREEALSAIQCAAQIFDEYSFDLIYTHPWHSLNEWQDELEEALGLARNHVSAYQLTIEPGTPFFGAFHRGDFQLPNDDSSAQFYELTEKIFEDRGYLAYEVSNYAKLGHECRHNKLYWTYGDYMGIGPGAHGRLTLDGVKTAFRQHRAPEIWTALVEVKGTGVKEQISLSSDEAFWEKLLMGARLRDGISYASFAPHLQGQSFWDKASENKKESLLREGYLENDADVFRVTKSGRLRLNAILHYLKN